MINQKFKDLLLSMELQERDHRDVSQYGKLKAHRHVIKPDPEKTYVTNTGNRLSTSLTTISLM